jgi:hypothetical protein
VPLRALGLGASFHGPANRPLTLLGGIRIKGWVRDERPVGAAQSVSPLSLRPPGGARRGRAARSPFALA